MSLAVRDGTDDTPSLTPLPGLEVRREHHAARMAVLQGRTHAEMQHRFDHGHRAYVATLHGVPAALGWVATREAEMGELRATLTLAPRERYLWNFVTLPPFRGRGVYPRLLDAIVRQELREADRCWIAYAPENHASRTGITNAGFAPVATLSFDDDGAPAVRGLVDGGGTMAARMLGLPETQRPLTPCWRCVRAGRGAVACRAGACRCDYQRPELGCASRSRGQST